MIGCLVCKFKTDYTQVTFSLLNLYTLDRDTIKYVKEKKKRLSDQLETVPFLEDFHTSVD